MKKITLFVIFAVILSLFVTANAVGEPRFVDDAALLDDYTQEKLSEELDRISEKYKMDIIVVTTYDTRGKTSMEFADDYYDYNGYGYGDYADGLLLLINMQDRELWISTCGKAIKSFTDVGIDYILDEIYLDMSDGEYESAIARFCELCETFIESAENGNPYDRNSLPKEPFSLMTALAVSVVIGFIAAFIVTGVMKGKLKSVRFQNTASDYERNGSLKITNSNEYLLYTHIDRIPIPKSSSGSSTHTSSSGRTHGSGGRRF